MQYTIRPAIPNDIDEIINLCSEHAEYERAEYDAFGKKEKLHAFLFSNQPRFFLFNSRKRIWDFRLCRIYV